MGKASNFAKRHKKLIIILAVVIVLAVVIGIAFFKSGNKQENDNIELEMVW
jgi:flagellar basal body-associated protein FliL